MKAFRLLSICATCTALIPLVTSCGSDNDSNSNPSNSTIEIDGNYLTSLSCGYSSCYLEYDANNRVSTVNPDISINYSKGIIYANDEIFKVKFNSAGLVTQLTTDWDYEDNGNKYKGNQEMSFTYNNEGRISNIKGIYKENITTPERTHKISSDATIKFTWTDGNLEKIVNTGSEIDSYGIYNWVDTDTYTYGTQANNFLQVPCCIGYTINDEIEWMALTATGLFGRGPKMLPILREERNVMTGDEAYENEISYPISFTTTNFGAIATEVVTNENTYTYGYGSTGRSANYNFVTKKNHSKHGIFIRHSKRKNESSI